MSTTYSKLALILVKDPITSSFIQQMAHEMGLLVRGVTTPEDAKSKNPRSDHDEPSIAVPRTGRSAFFAGLFLHHQDRCRVTCSASSCD